MDLNGTYPGFDEYRLCRDRSGKIWLWGFGKYDSSSVLGGQQRQCRLDCFDTEEQARGATGLLEVGDEPMRLEVEMPSSQPSWFDPMAAGEVWGEEDY